MLNITNHQGNANQIHKKIPHLTPVRLAIIKKTNNCWRACRKKRTLIHCWWECKLAHQVWKTVWITLKKLKIELRSNPQFYFWVLIWRNKLIQIDFGRTVAKAETPILWPPHAKSWLIGKDSDAGRDWGQEEKGTTEDEMAGWHHRLDGHEFGWTPGVGDGQGGLACCSSWGRKELDTTEWLNWTPIFIAILLTIAKIWKPPKCPSIDK